MARLIALLIVTAVAELIGCYLVLLWSRSRAGSWALVPAAIALGLFAKLLTLHPGAAGRLYAAYGGVYIGASLVWLWLVEGQRPDAQDWVGASLSLLGAGVVLAHRE